VGCGGKHVIYSALQTICDVGDEVIFASPYWVSYPDMVKLAGGKPVAIPTRAEDGFALDPDTLRAAITERTCAIILNTPSNPTGMRIDRPRLEELARIAAENDLWILSDEIYDELCYDDEPYLSPISLGPEVRAHTLALNSFSKTYSMTGWRIGYAVGPVELIKAMSKVQAQSTSNASTLSQMAALEALTGDQSSVAERRQAFARRRQRIMAGLRAIEGFDCVMDPQGAFYVFPATKALYGKRLGERPIDGSMDLSMALLEEAHVATVPGVAFGDDDHIRLSYAIGQDQIDEGLRRISEMVGRLER
jgi:aspartate aminotransferase